MSNPEEGNLLFERFISRERNEPPDIDVDFEHERREEVIQYIYDKYGRDHAGIAATVITYRSRSAVREVGKAFGLSEDAVGALAGNAWGWSSNGVDGADVRRAGLDPEERRIAQMLELSREIIGFPRHLSQHVGGFVITRSRLDEVVPIMQCRDGRPQHHRMGQGRPRRARHAQDRRARPRHADLPAEAPSTCSRTHYGETLDARHRSRRRRVRSTT